MVRISSNPAEIDRFQSHTGQRINIQVQRAAVTVCAGDSVCVSGRITGYMKQGFCILAQCNTHYYSGSTRRSTGQNVQFYLCITGYMKQGFCIQA